MDKIYVTKWNSPIGDMILGEYDGKLCLSDWYNRKHRNRIDRRICDSLSAEYHYSKTKFIESAIIEIEEYFQAKRTVFSVPLLPLGSEFQKSVWLELMNIEYGKTANYSEIAKRIENPNSVRAVSTAIGMNALSIFIPCHRIISKDSKLSGYAGGIEAKQKLLDIEKLL